MTATHSLQYRIADLPTRKPTAFALKPQAEERAEIAKALNIDAIKKLSFAGQITAVGADDWLLTAQLGATVVQPCVSTLAPVTTRIDETISRTYVKDAPAAETGEVEMPEDDTIDPLPDVLDITAVMVEALSLALPPFPRASDAGESNAYLAAPPGVSPMTDEEAKPFSGLKDLRAALEKKAQDDPE